MKTKTAECFIAFTYGEWVKGATLQLALKRAGRGSVAVAVYHVVGDANPTIDPLGGIHAKAGSSCEKIRGK